VAEWIIGFIQSHGLLAVALLMFLENVFPPLPSELIMPFAGFAAARGDMSLVLVTVGASPASAESCASRDKAPTVDAPRRPRLCDHRPRLVATAPGMADHHCAFGLSR